MRSLLTLALLLPLAACSATPTATDRPGLQAAWAELTAEEEAAEADLALALESGDAEAAEAVRADLEALAAEKDAVEEQVLRERTGALTPLLTALLGPAGAGIGAAATALAPLARRRSRRKYVRALQAANPFGGSPTDPSVPKPLAPGEAVVSLVDSFRELLTPGDEPNETTES